MVEPDGIEPLGAALINKAYRVTAGNREQPPKFVTLSAMLFDHVVSGKKSV